MTLIKRIPKGDPLTFQEMDGNWDDLSARLTVDASNKQFSVLGVAPPAAQTTTLPVIYKERNINQVLSGQIHPRGDQ